ncbi:hypothetical protein GGF46_003986 [Coemansia sp. RSA 552]|nr:hypothetical protein GGF46_003986 [Coemansia sp. RSA 552]
MPTNEDLQKRVDVLQRQLRKAGEHLKRLAAENGTLSEQVETLTGRETQLQAQAQELAAAADGHKDELARIREETDANSQGDAQTAALKAECEEARQSAGKLEAQIAEMRKESEAGDKTRLDLEADAQEWAARLGMEAKETGPALLQAIRAHIDKAADSGAKELSQEISQLRLDATRERESMQDLEDQIAKASEGEAVVAQVLGSWDSIDQIPSSVPEALRPGLEHTMRELSAAKAAAQDKGPSDTITALESELESTRGELAEVSQAREELGKDYDLLVERIGTMRDALKAKMNAESDELKRLRSEAATAKQMLERRDRDVGETKKALWESQESASRSQIEHRDAVSEYERQVSELRARAAAAEQQLDSDTAQHTELEERIEVLQGDLNQALNAESEWVEERDVHLVTIQNLQSALETLQKSKDSDVDFAVESLHDELRQAAAAQSAAEARAKQAEDRLRRIELSGASAEQCQQKITGQTAEIERLRHEVAVLKDHLNESMRRLREESSEFNLDKRVITNLIVGFLALPYGDSKRFEILKLMSSILQFTEEQQEKVGLIRKAGRRLPLQSRPGTPVSETSATPSETKDSFSDQWISFLLRESSTRRGS